MSNKVNRDFLAWIISGPSGSGKTTLCEALLKDRVLGKSLLKSVSYTTRLRRSNEKEGQDYHYISKDKFLELKSDNALLENEKIFETYYGTPKSIVNTAQKKGRDLLLAIDVKGAAKLRRYFKEKAVSIFIMPPDIQSLVKRLTQRRTETKKDIEKRLKRVKIETLCARDYDYIVINDDVDAALSRIKSIMVAKKCEVKSRDKCYFKKDSLSNHAENFLRRKFSA